jgi:Mg2+/Co2+ transporter CorB
VVRQPVRAGPIDTAEAQAGEEVEARLSQEEVRSLVLEGHFFRGKHRAMLANLFDLASVSVDDVMTPRNQIEAIDLNEKPALLAQQLATSYHTMLAVYEDSLDNIVGLLHLKQVLRLRQAGRDRRRGAARDPARALLHSGRKRRC